MQGAIKGDADAGRRRSLAVPFRRWLWRYGPAELIGTAAALLGAAVAASAGGLLIGVAAAWAENLGFYGTLAAADVRARRGEGQRQRRFGRLRLFLGTLGALLLEFGPAEVLDSLLLRPALMSLGVRLAPSPAFGIVAGKLAADLLFYVPTIAIWEWRRAAHRRAAVLPRSPEGSGLCPSHAPQPGGYQ